MAFPTVFNVGDLDGTNGFRVRGTLENPYGYGSIDIVGDINGDGLDDFVFTFAEQSVGGKINVGAAYVIYGSKSKFRAEFDIGDLEGSNGFRIEGIEPQGLFGFGAQAIGDVNGDGRSDFAISAIGSEDAYGSIHIFYGRSSNFAAAIDARDADLVVEIRQSGPAGVGVLFESGAVAAGDVNGDGLSDFMAGGLSGPAFVVFGKKGGLGALDLGALDGSDGFAIGSSDFASDPNAYSAAIVGDVNGDGIDDIAVGSDASSGPGSHLYVMFGGRKVGASGAVDLSRVDGKTGFRFEGFWIGDDNFIHWIDGAGDVNGDGFEDVIVGGQTAGSASTAHAYVIYGSSKGFPATIRAGDLNGKNGFAISSTIPEPDGGPYRVAYAVKGAGDINGDGYDDIAFSTIFGERGVRNEPLRVIFGGPKMPASFDLADLNGRNGFTLESDVPNSLFGSSLAGAGDLNGDGASDLVVFAPRTGVSAGPDKVVDRFGVVNVVFGIPADTAIRGTPKSDRKLKGTKGEDVILGLEGNDIVRGLAGNDSLDGGVGNDVLIGGTGADTLIGGKGQDTASYEDATKGVTANLKNATQNKGEAKGDTYKSVENLTGSKKADKLTGDDGANIIKGMGGNDTLVGGKGKDRLEGGAGKDVLTGGAHADLFVFKAVNDSPSKKKGWDVITDFSRKQGDRIDLKAIDAKSGTRKDDAFVFVGKDAFSGKKGELRFDANKKKTFVYGDVNGDSTADIRIELTGKIDLQSKDFVL